VISMSLGSYGDSPVLWQAVQYAEQRGVILVAAAGNDAQNQLVYPARYPGVVAVGGVDAMGRHLEFSNSGDQVALAAPGYGVYSSWTDDQTVSFSGTSAAVPFVSGAVATVLSENPQINGTQAVEILTQNADDRGAPGSDPQFGSGILDLNRVESRNQSGILDIAIADQFLESQQTVGGTVSFSVIVQNRGTEPIPNVRLEVAWNGTQQQFYFSNVLVGQSLKQTLQLYDAAYDPSKPTTVTSTASIVGGNDSRSFNNQLASIIQLKQN
jgi:subtilisin family serine protease